MLSVVFAESDCAQPSFRHLYASAAEMVPWNRAVRSLLILISHITKARMIWFWILLLNIIILKSSLCCQAQPPGGLDAELQGEAAVCLTGARSHLSVCALLGCRDEKGRGPPAFREQCPPADRLASGVRAGLFQSWDRGQSSAHHLWARLRIKPGITESKKNTKSMTSLTSHLSRRDRLLS